MVSTVSKHSRSPIIPPRVERFSRSPEVDVEPIPPRIFAGSATSARENSGGKEGKKERTDEQVARIRR